MTDKKFDDLRARLDHAPKADRSSGHGDFYRAVIRRPTLLPRFRRWMKRPWMDV